MARKRRPAIEKGSAILGSDSRELLICEFVLKASKNGSSQMWVKTLDEVRDQLTPREMAEIVELQGKVWAVLMEGIERSMVKLLG
jgi:hypothetical protein